MTVDCVEQYLQCPSGGAGHREFRAHGSFDNYRPTSAINPPTNDPMAQRLELVLKAFEPGFLDEHHYLMPFGVAVGKTSVILCSARPAAGTKRLHLAGEVPASRLPRCIRYFECRPIAQAIKVSRQIRLARKIRTGLSGGHTCLTQHDIGRTEVPC